MKIIDLKKLLVKVPKNTISVMMAIVKEAKPDEIAYNPKTGSIELKYKKEF